MIGCIMIGIRLVTFIIYIKFQIYYLSNIEYITVILTVYSIYAVILNNKT